MITRQHGFTLVEVLISLSIAALLVSLVYGAVRVGQRSTTALIDQTGNNEVMRIGWQFMHDAIARARLISRLDDVDNKTLFQGRADSLRFIADVPAYVGIGGLMQIDLAIDSSVDGEKLILSRQHFNKATRTATNETTQQAVLVEELKSFDIRYFGATDIDLAPSWQSDWSNQVILPNLIQISVTPAKGEPWPVLIARPLTGTVPLDDEIQPTEGEIQ